MNNDNKTVDQNPVSGIQVQHQATVGVANKEIGRINAPVSEFLRPAGAEVSPNLSSEEKESGVQVKSDRPDLTFEHREIGLEHSGATVPVPPGPTSLVQISEEQDINSSGTWLNALTEKIQKVMRLMGV